MNSKRRFPRTDRPGSGIYEGNPSPGVAFDDYRAADEHEIHHRPGKKSLWKSLLDFLKYGPFPLDDSELEKSAKAAIARDPTLETGQVKIFALEGILHVSGSVPTHWMKERISDCLLEVDRVTEIRNDLEIKSMRNKLPQEGELIA